jgi:hypothetical protein
MVNVHDKGSHRKCSAEVNCLKFDILKAVTVMITVIWDVTPCSLVDCYTHIGGTVASNRVEGCPLKQCDSVILADSIFK